MRTTLGTPAVTEGRSRPRRSALIAALIAAMKTWWTAYLTRRNEREAILQLHAMNDRELRDIGLTRSEIEGAVRGREDQRPFTRHD